LNEDEPHGGRNGTFSVRISWKRGMFEENDAISNKLNGEN